MRSNAITELDRAIAERMALGWRVESRTAWRATLIKWHRPNRILHAMLAVLNVMAQGSGSLTPLGTSTRERLLIEVDAEGALTVHPLAGLGTDTHQDDNHPMP
ncbi:hypothetical protein [Streptomyces sp. NPDC012888]|uniref:hypothetical protein n=1 Tax=Streptomyces sp. NPDC012888 TaxID=3364855 RepID=UPI0036AC068A